MKWINVKDKLPDLDKHVLIYAEKIEYNVCKGIYSGFYELDYTDEYRWRIRHEVNGYEWQEEFPKVTHWMELPDGPYEG